MLRALVPAGAGGSCCPRGRGAAMVACKSLRPARAASAQWWQRQHGAAGRPARPAGAGAGCRADSRQSLPDILQGGARLTAAAHAAWAEFLRPGDTAVDATAGNGHDTLFLARAVLEGGRGRALRGRVVAFDVQEAAVRSTSALLEAGLPDVLRAGVEVVQGCHSTLGERVAPRSARLVCFNLGYLPGGDKACVSQPATTVAAVAAALEACQEGGLVSILAYTRHDGGEEEYAGVADLVAGLPPSEWVASEHRLVNRSHAPILILVYRRPQGKE